MSASGQFAGRTVLITGASAGIGAELARQFAARGADLLLLARRRDKLEALAAQLRAGGTVVALAEADVTRDGDVGRAVVAAPGSRVDIVVANAGFGVAGPIQKLALADYRRQYETNVFGVLRTIYETLDALRASRGKLVIIGSVAGYAAAPGASAYASSKFALRGVADAIRGDLAGDGIRVTLVCPGFVDSDIRRTDNRGALHAEVADPIPGWLRVATPRAVRTIIDAVHRGRAEIVVTAHGKAIVFVARHLPWLVRLVTSRGAVRGRAEPKG